VADVTAAAPGNPCWRKSSASNFSGNCAEIAAWRKSSRSNGTNCAEVGQAEIPVIGVRDSKLEHSPVLAFPAAAWERFTAPIRETP
jgi:hypothetical protein